MSLLKIMNPIACIPSEYNLDEAQGVGFKRTIKSRLVRSRSSKRIKPLNELKEDRSKHLTEVKKSQLARYAYSRRLCLENTKNSKKKTPRKEGTQSRNAL